MATSKYVRGLSGAGFRVPDNGSATALQRVTENLNGSSHNYQVDLDDDRTQKILLGEKDNFVRVAGNTSTTTTIIGLTRYGFRIKNSAGAIVAVKLGSGVHTLTLNGRTARVLRRNYGRYLFATDANNVTIRGIVAQQNGFDIKASTKSSAAKLTNANPTNVSNADTVTVGAKTYTFKTALTEKKATAILSSDGTIPTDGDTVTVNNVTYRLKGTIAQANDVHLVTSSDVTLDNLVKAVNQSGISGTDYFAGTVAPTGVTAGARAGTGATGNVTFTATAVGVAGNAFPSTETSTHLSYLGTTFGAGGGATVVGADSVANEVFIGGSADASLTNLSEAINAGANAGVDYSSATTANADATASAVAAHAITFTGIEGGSQTVAITESTSGVRLTVNDGTVTDALVKVYSGKSATVDPQDPNVYTQLRRHFKSYVEA